jgi:glycosyltransferase involved in cell wall biosynthesis
VSASTTVTIAVPVLNEEHHIEACLDAIAEQTYPNIVEVLVIDGGSTDRTRELALRLGATVLDNPRRIQSAALNVALEEAKGDVFVRVDGHCEVARDYVERCVQALAETGAAMVGGAMTPTIGTTSMQRAIAAAMQSRLGVGPARFHAGGGAGWVDTVYLGAFRVDLAQEVGGYSEDVGVNEDAEFAIRIGTRGGVRFDPTIRSVYVPRGSLRAVAKQFYRYGWSRAHTIARHPSSMRLRQLAPLVLVALLLYRRTRRPVATLYGAGLGLASATAGMSQPLDRLRFVAVAATMHLTWAGGFIGGLRSAWRSRV